MKKLIFTTILIIFIPYILISIFIHESEEIKLKSMKNMTIRIKRHESGVIDVVPIEEYIVGVVSGEMPISFDMEALKAQAVAARSYVLKQLEYNMNNDYDVVDTVMNQVYLDSEQLKNNWGENYLNNLNKAKTAVLETKGEYLDCDGSVVEALFFSTSTGFTENSGEIFPTQQPYLKSVVSTWDADVSPVYNDYFYFSLNEFYNRLSVVYADNIDIKIESTTSTGRIKQIRINGKLFTGDEIQYLLGLRSTFFSIYQDGSNVTINTKGFGHGVGMSQYGAQGMAINGYKYDEILKYYYQGVEIKKIY